MLHPDGPTIEALQTLGAAGHVAKPPQPDKSIRVVEIAELADHPHPQGFLALDEFAVEEVDEDITLAWMQGVLAELNNWRPTRLRCWGGRQVIGCVHGRPAVKLCA